MQNSLKNFLSSQEDGSFFVGHASVLARIDKKLIMFDFVRNINFFLNSWFFFPKLEWTKEIIKKLDYIFISHSHDDHFDPVLLKKIPKNIKIFLPAKRVGFENFLKNHKIKNIFMINPNKIQKIDPTISAMAIPSDHNDIDSSYFIKGKKFSLYHGNDNFLSPHLIKKAVSKFGPANHAYIPFAYVWWYPFCLTSISSKRRKNEGKRLSNKNMIIGEGISRALKPDVVIPFAANMVYYDPASVINKETANTFDFKTFCRKKKSIISNKVQNLFPGDYVLKNKLKNQIFSKKINKKIFFEKLKNFLKKAKNIYNADNKKFKIENNLKKLKTYQKKLSKLKKIKLNRNLYVRTNNHLSKIIKIDPWKRNISLVNKIEKKNSYIFTFDPIPLKAWLEKKVSFEDVLNSQRFTLERYPEEFRQDIWKYIRNYL